MLDKIIQKLKNLIPKKKPAEEKKVETAAPPPGGPPASGKAANNLDPKAKKRQLIIKIVAGIAILYFALDEFVLKKETEEAPPEPVATAKRAERKPKKSLKDLQKPPEGAPARDMASVPPAGVPQEPPKPPAPEVSTAPPETPPAAPAPSETAVETTTEPIKISEEETAVTEPKPVETEPSGEAPESTMAAEGPATTIEKPTEEIAKDMEKVVQEVGPIPEEEIKPAEKVELPDYSIKGRGLVYNCGGKHWACIDRAGYLNCKEHMRWTEENKRPPECVIKNVYASEEDCSVVQLHYINTNEPSDFCKKN